MADTVIYGTSGNDTIASNASGTSNGSLILTVAGTIGENQLPMFNVLINGVVVRSSITATASYFGNDTQQVYVALPPGPITSVSVDYTNDPQNDDYSLDRNLIVHKVTLNGADLPVSSAVYTRDGFTGPHNAENGATIDGQSDMNWGGEMTWTGPAVTTAVAGPGGSTLIDAGLGIDTVTFSGTIASYTVGHTATGFSVTPDAGGTTTYFGSVERLDFSDKMLAIDMDGNAGVAARLLITLLGQEFLEDEGLAGLLISYLDQGLSAEQLAGGILDNADWQAFAGGSSNGAYVTEMYTNLAGGPPSAGDFNYLVGLLDSGAITKAGMTMIAMEHEAVDIRMTGVTSTGLEYMEM